MTTEVIKYEPKKPVANAGTLKALFAQMAQGVAEILPKHIDPQKMLRAALHAATKNPALFKCTQESFFGALMDASRLGLAVGGGGPAGEAHLVPFKNEVVLIPDYRGLVKLARQSGEIGRIEAEAVFANDHFKYAKGTDFTLEFRPAKGDRGELECFYALVLARDGMPLAADYMSVEDVQKVRKAAASKNSPAWKEWFPEMGKKTVLRRCLKLAPISAEKLHEAIALSDREFDFGPVEIDVTDTTKTEALAEKIGKKREGGERSPNKLTDEEVAQIMELCAAEPPVSFDELEEMYGDSLSEVEFPKGQNPLSQVRLEVRDMKKAAAAG